MADDMEESSNIDSEEDELSEAGSRELERKIGEKEKKEILLHCPQ